MSETIRILLADDAQVIRDSLRLLLNTVDDLTVVGEAGDGIEALRLAEELMPDVLLLDVDMPGLTGVEVARRLQATESPVKVLALSAFDDAAYVAGLLAAGAADYLLKEEAAPTVIDAIRGVARGQSGYFSPAVAAQVAAQARDETHELNTLTAGEVAVVRLVADGQSNRAIGAALGISEKAVEKRLQNVFEKWDVQSRTEAAVRAVREGLIFR